MRNRREYTTEFKLEAIKLVRETGQLSAKIARDLGMSGLLPYNYPDKGISLRKSLGGPCLKNAMNA